MTPQFKIIANQADITLIIQQRLISIRITDESGIKGDTSVMRIEISRCWMIRVMSVWLAMILNWGVMFSP